MPNRKPKHKPIRKPLTPKKIPQYVIVFVVILGVLLLCRQKNLLAQLFLYEALPSYQFGSHVMALFKHNSAPDDGEGLDAFGQEMDSTEPYFKEPGEGTAEETMGVEIVGTEDYETDRSGSEDPESESSWLVGLNDVIYQTPADSMDVSDHFFDKAYTIENIEALKDLSFLKNKFYIVEKYTDVTSEQFDVERFLQTDFTIQANRNIADQAPKILVFHTHSQELYKDSRDVSEGVVGLGEELCRVLEEKYGIKTLHVTDNFDLVNGRSARDGAYERMEPVIWQILRENPSIEIAIDLHRDGVAETTHLISSINGKSTAQIMFLNGLSKIYNNGTLMDIASLPNENIRDNLAFSFQMQLKANELYPGFTRKIYLKPYRYSLHMLPKSLLIEAGAQTNTKEEAFNAAEPIADILAGVVLR